MKKNKIALNIGGILVIVALLMTVFFSLPAGAADTQTEITDIKKELTVKEEQALMLKSQLASIEAELEGTVRNYSKIYGDLAETQDKMKKNEELLEGIKRDQDYYQELLNKRVRSIYQNGDISLVEVLMSSKDFKDFLVRIDFLKKVSDNDTLMLDEVKKLRVEYEDKEEVLALEKANEESLLQDVEDIRVIIENLFNNYNKLISELDQDVIELKNTLTTKEDQLSVERKADELRKLAASGQASLPIDIIFPVNEPYSFINDWHFPRAGGRLHKGNDIFAPYGTPLVAAKDGVISKANFNDVGLGGITVTIRGIDGNSYYYAHLSSIADGITKGATVNQGQLVGFVGNSGDARTTPSHLHFMIFPGGSSAAINPYPYLIKAESR